MGTIFFLFYAALLTILIVKWRFFRIRRINRFLILGVFYLKLLAGAGLTILYSQHYEDRGTGDTFRFFDDALIMHECFHEEDFITYTKLLTGIGFRDDAVAMEYYNRMTHLERPHSTGYVNDNATMIRGNAILMHLSRGHYAIHLLFWCFMAMMGLTALLRLLVTYFPRKRVAMFCSVYLLPTVVFWGSGVLKEPIMLLGLGLFLLGFFRYLFEEWKPKHMIYIVIGVFFLAVSKGYILYLITPAIFGLLLVKLSRGRRFWLWFSIPHMLLVLLVGLSAVANDPLDLIGKIVWKQAAFYNEAELSGAGSLIDIPRIEGAADIFLNAPAALINTYLRPWIWEGGNILYLPAGLENMALLICFMVMLWNFRRPYGLAIPIIAFALSFVLLLGIVMGSVVPVLGALVRYKMPALIFLFAFIFIHTDHIMLQRRLPFIRKIVRKLWPRPY